MSTKSGEAHSNITQGARTYAFAHNGLGDRVSQTVNGTPTNYKLDLAAGLTQVLTDGPNTYLYGMGRIGEQQPGGFVYHLADALGSVRQLAYAGGAVTLARNYEPYGDTLSSAGSGATAFQFTGEMRDASGLTYLRARYLSTGVGRFITRDTWGGDYMRPLSLNLWNYAASNAVNFTDPSGLVPCAENQAARFCALVEGGFVDLAHFKGVRDLTQDLIKVKLPQVFGKRFGEVYVEQHLSILPKYTRKYSTAIPSGISYDDLVGVALGIVLDFEYGYETRQFIDPRCFTILGYGQVQEGISKVTGYDIGHCSSFSNEDLPSDYLGFVSASKGLSFEEILGILGGGEQLDSENPPDAYWGGPRNPILCALGLCPENSTPWNYQCTLKAFNEGTKQFVNRPWPSELRIEPIGFGSYWGRSATDFAQPVPRPPDDLN